MFRKPLILAVDDEPHIRQLMRRVLEPAGYEVITAVDSNQALNLVAEKNPDLVLLDIKMPGKSGLEVLSKIKTSYPDTAVIMVTVVDDIGTAISTIRQGASDYLNKPFNTDEIVLGVGKTLEKKRLILESREYQFRLEERINEQTRLLEQKKRELAALTNLFVTHLNQSFEAAETQTHLADNIIKAAEKIRTLAQQAEALRIEAQTSSTEEKESPKTLEQ